jgi:hypothetical protein
LYGKAREWVKMRVGWEVIQSMPESRLDVASHVLGCNTMPESGSNAFSWSLATRSVETSLNAVHAERDGDFGPTGDIRGNSATIHHERI